jgi:hypothetical protein
MIPVLTLSGVADVPIPFAVKSSVPVPKSINVLAA